MRQDPKTQNLTKVKKLKCAKKKCDKPQKPKN